MSFLPSLYRSFRRVYLRFVFLLLSPALLAITAIALYVFLPFPAPTDLELDAKERLEEGRWVTRVYDADILLRHRTSDPTGLYAQHGRSYFSLTFTHSPSSPFTLSFLLPNSSLLSLPIPIGTPASRPSLVARVPGVPGDSDGVSLPWFAPADAAILWSRGAEYLPDRAEEREAALLVVTTAFAESERWAQGEGTVAFTLHAGTLNNEGETQPVIPLLSLSLLPGNASYRALDAVAFSPPSTSSTSDGQDVQTPTVFAPSYTLPLRTFILDTIIFCAFASSAAIALALKLLLWFGVVLALVVTGWIGGVVWADRRTGKVALRSPILGMGVEGKVVMDTANSGCPIVIVTDNCGESISMKDESRF